MAKLKFAKKDSQKNSDLNKKKWKVLICDDELEVHKITQTVLENFSFEDGSIEFLNAYTGKEALEILRDEKDIALILLDVVMESDDAGLIVAKSIREELNNHLIRIILRTGQPGSAPEKEVINKYDINDYKEKTELTATKLYTTIISALRSYRDLKIIEQNKSGLEKIIEATKTIFKNNSLDVFAEGVLMQLLSILKLNKESLIISHDGISFEKDGDNYKILASTGKFKNHEIDEVLDNKLVSLLNESIEKQSSIFNEHDYVGYFRTDLNKANLIYISGCKDLSPLDKNLLEIFSSNVSVAFNNLYLNKEIIDTQKELIETLGETVEKRSKEASKHVQRVAYISYKLAILYGLDEKEAMNIRMASPMHDVGKIGIPDSILLKPGLLTDEEFEEMKKHAQIGHDILGHSKREVLQTASIIAHEHHEKWDGSGYPNQKSGEEIHIYGRITAVADVFDALLHRRCYKEPWPLEKVIELFKNESGKHFDPKLVELLLENLEVFEKIIKSTNNSSN